MARKILFAVLAVLLAPAARAQTDPAILATVQRMFDAMRSRDTVAFRATVDSGARLFSTSVRNGQPTLRVVPIGQFILSVGRSQQRLDERIFDPVIQVDQNLATVWVRYEFWLGDQFSHCGYDAFHLFRGADGWKIITIADTQSSQGCPGR